MTGLIVLANERASAARLIPSLQIGYRVQKRLQKRAKIAT
jgi:hypothetical protein